MRTRPVRPQARWPLVLVILCCSTAWGFEPVRDSKDLALTVDLPPGLYAVVATEFGSDVSLSIGHRRVDSPRGGGSQEVLVLDVQELESFSIEVRRFDNAKDGEFELAIDPISPGSSISHIGEALRLFAEAEKSFDVDLYAEAVEEFRRSKAPMALVNAAWVARVRLDDPVTAAELSAVALSIPENSVVQILSGLEYARALTAVQPHSMEAVEVLTEILGTEASSVAFDFGSRLKMQAKAELCLIFRYQLKIEAAIACYREVELGFAERGLNRDRANALHNLGSALNYAGKFSASEEAFNAALDIYESLEDRRGAARVRTVRSTVLMENGQLEPASSDLDGAIKVFLEMGPERWLARALANTARLGMIRGDQEEKIQERISKAMDRAVSSSDWSTAVYAATLSLDLSRSGGSYGSLFSLLENPQLDPSIRRWANLVAAKIAAERGDIGTASRFLQVPGLDQLTPKLWELYWLSRSAIALAQGQPDVANSFARAAMHSAKTRGDALAELESISMVLTACGRCEEEDLIALSTSGSHLSTDLARSFRQPEHRAKVFRHTQVFYDAMVLALHKGSDRAKKVAVGLLSEGRAQALKAHLNAARPLDTESLSIAMERVRMAVWNQVLVDDNELAAAISVLKATEAAMWGREEPAGLSEPIVLPLMNLEHGHLLQFIYEGAETDYIFSIEESGISVSVAELEAAEMSSVVESMGSPNGKGLWEPALPELSKLLLGPAFDSSNGYSHVTFVLDSTSWALAPSMLVQDYPTEYRPAIENIAFNVAPTLAHAFIEDERVLDSAAIIGDGIVSRSDVRLEGMGQGASSKEMAELPGTRREIASVAEALTGIELRIFDGFDANRGVLGDDAVKNAALLHIAGHALPAKDGVSSLVLGLYGENGEPSPEILLPWEVSHAPLSATLVFLSACALDDGAEFVFGDNLDGLSSSFLYAGAKTVVTTRWPVDDNAAARFASEVYSELANGELIGEAVRRTQERLSLSTRFSHPYYWAGYVVIGAGDVGLKSGI